MVKNFVGLFFCLLISIFGVSQDFNRHGILSAQATIAPGFYLVDGLSDITVHGDLEYFVNDRISVRGDGYYMVDYLGDAGVMDERMTLYSGFSYYLTEGKALSPFVGVAPGVGIATGDELYFQQNQIQYVSGKAGVFPLISTVVGCYYFAGNWFHIFGQARFSAGTYATEYSAHKAGQLQLSFGLGFNLNTRKSRTRYPTRQEGRHPHPRNLHCLLLPLPAWAPTVGSSRRI